MLVKTETYSFKLSFLIFVKLLLSRWLLEVCTLGLLWVHHADVDLDPTWCAPGHWFLLTGSLFGSPTAKPHLKAEEHRECLSRLRAVMERTHAMSVTGSQNHMAEGVSHCSDSVDCSMRDDFSVENTTASYVTRLLHTNLKRTAAITSLYSHGMPASSDPT